jgi:succinyl-diaminopimelate desuccinylase
MVEKNLLELLSIDSLTGEEEKISIFLQKKFQNFQNFELVKKHWTLCYFSKNTSSEKKTIAFYGHLDTVCNQQTKPVQKCGDFIYGCGASDMKAGLAVMVALMEFLEHKKNAPYNYQFIFYTGEEGSYRQSGLEGIFHTIPKLKEAQMAFVLEPTNNNIQSGCLGSVRAQAKILGKSGHSARPWLADNAIHKSWKLLQFFSEQKPQTVQLDSLKFFEVMSITMMNSGILSNVIPDEARFFINYRYAPNKQEKQAEEVLLQLLQDKVDDIKILENSPSGKIVKNELTHKIAEQFSLKIEPKQAWTDIARLTSEGIDAINLGAGDPSEAHQKNEKVSVRQLLKSFEIYKYIIFELAHAKNTNW